MSAHREVPMSLDSQPVIRHDVREDQVKDHSQGGKSDQDEQEAKESPRDVYAVRLKLKEDRHACGVIEDGEQVPAPTAYPVADSQVMTGVDATGRSWHGDRDIAPVRVYKQQIGMVSNTGCGRVLVSVYID
jgi:hypothetical protein